MASERGGLPFAYATIADDITRELVPIRSSDGSDSIAVYYARRGHTPKTNILVIHPRGDYTRFYGAPGLAARGYGVLCQCTRYINNDTDAQHERMLLDIAAGMRHLRSRGSQDILILGNSGGGSLTTFYQSQAQLAGDARLTHTPGGDRVPLAGEDMPLATGQIHVAVHIGEGDFTLKTVDPAVIDEEDPTMTDPEIDMYNPANGKRPYPESSTYDRGWLERYRAAQAERCRRLDARARAWLADRFVGQEAKPEPGSVEAYNLERTRRSTRYMVIYRTLANPFYTDMSIDPSDREVGSSFAQGIDPLVGNYGMSGLARTMTPRGWLSTWSPNGTNASMLRSLPAIDIPSLFVNASGDTEVGPGEFHEITEASRAADKTVRTIRGNHYLRPLAEGDRDPREELDEIMGEWLAKRFG